jgi:hypothetical protein
VPTGYLEICKEKPAGDPLTGTFTFRVSGVNNDIVVPVGQCSPAIQVQAGSAVVTELPRAGTELVDIIVQPSGRLIGVPDIPNRRVTVTIAPGDISTQTVVRFVNRTIPGRGQLKICKIATGDIAVRTPFRFEVTSPQGRQTYTVEAGFCILDGIFDVGTVVTVQEIDVPPNVSTTAIRVDPSDRIVGTPNLANRTIMVRIGTGFTEVTFTNHRDVRTGQLKLCKVAGAGITVGTNFTISAGLPGGALVPYTVQAGPAPGGYCILDGVFPVGTRVVVQESIPSGVEVGAILVGPTDRLVPGSINLGLGRAEVIIGTGFTEVTVVNRRRPGDEGCSHGFWKNHTNRWPSPYTQSTTLGSVFTFPAGANQLASSTFAQALSFGGGPGITGAQQNLFRQAVAALLNAASPDVNYPLTVAEVVAQVNAALASNDRQTILNLAGTLDRFNNLRCRLD